MRLVALVVGLALFACAQHDTAGVRAKAAAILAARRPEALPDLPLACPPGSAMAGVRGCSLTDDQRARMRTDVLRKYNDLFHESFKYCHERRDRLATVIVERPAEVDAMVSKLVLAYANCHSQCGAPIEAAAHEIELRNAFFSTLQAVLAADSPPRDAGGMPALERVSDDYLIDLQIEAEVFRPMYDIVNAALSE